MYTIPISQKTIKVIDKIVNNNNIPNTILFYNDYSNLGISIVLNLITSLTPNKKNIYNNPDISFVIPMTTSEKDYKENMTEKQAINLGLKALSAANENNLKAEVIEIAVISTDKEFGTLDTDLVSGEIKKIK